MHKIFQQFRRSTSAVNRTRCQLASKRRQFMRGLFESLESRCLLASDFELMKDISIGPTSSDPSFVTEMNGGLFFSADGELWKSDGTPIGTVQVADINVGPAGANVTNLTNVNGTLFFNATDGATGYELWKSDGTAAGTQMVKDILPGASGSGPQWLTNVNGTLFFSATNSGVGQELWKSDGSASGTVLIKDIRPGNFSSSLRYFTNVNGTLFFDANDGVTSLELWKSDGTFAGTQLVKDINPGAGFGSPKELANINGTLFFGAVDGTSGEELWKSDGTAAGTIRVFDITPGAPGSLPRYITNVNGLAYFTANNGVNGRELWKSNGTVGGTMMVKDLWPGVASGSPSAFQGIGSTVYFSSSDGVNGFEFWKSDGTTAGTVMVKDINPGPAESAPRSLIGVDNKLYMTANDGINGFELWSSDGTETGTLLEFDFSQDASNGMPSRLTIVGDKLFTVAATAALGRELYASAPAVNNAPTDITLSDAVIDENAPIGTLVGILTTIDPDAGDEFVYSLTGGPGSDDNSSFTVEPDGRILSAASFDFEIQNSYSIRVRATDIGGLSTEKSFLITISDLNEFIASIPEDIDPTVNSVTENALVDTLTGITAFSQDLDVTNNTITYSLLSDAGGLFKIDVGTGVVRVASAGINFENDYEHTIIVRATSSDGSVADQAFLIAVVNVVEANDIELIGTSGNDQFDVRYVGSGTSNWIVHLNGLPLFSGLVPVGGQLILLGTGGLDTITLFGRTSADTFVIGQATVDVNGFTMAGYHMEQRIVRGENGNDLFQLLGGSAAIDGGTGSDRLLGNDVGNQFSIFSANAGNLNDTSSFTSIETLTGGIGADEFSFLSGGSLSGQVQGGTGNDRLNYSMRTTAASVNLNSSTATSTGGWVGIEAFAGSSGPNDVIVGRNTSNTWMLDGANQGQVNGEFSFEGIERLTGGTQIDTFLFTASAAVISGLIQGGGGSDSLNFAALSTPVQINLASASSDRVGSFASIESAVGSSSTLDTLVGIDGTNAWTIQGENQGTVRSFAFSDIEILHGGAGADTITFANTNASLSGGVVGNGGIDTLVAANQNNLWTIDNPGSGTLNSVAFQSIENLTGSSAIDVFTVSGTGQLQGTIQAGSQGVGQRDVLSYVGFGAAVVIDIQSRSGTGIALYNGIEEVQGAPGQSSTLLGSDASNNNWSVTGTNSGTVGQVTFGLFDRLVGGALSDTFSVTASGSVTGMIDGGDGNDTLVGAAVDSNWQIMALDQGRLESTTASTLFQGIENLTGGTATDAFLYSPPGALSGNISGGAGTDSIDLTQSIGPLEIVLSSTRSITNLVSSFTGIEQVSATSDVSDRIVGASANTTWQFNATGQVVVAGITYTGLEVVQGGSATDTLVGPNLSANWTIDGAGAGQISVGLSVLRFESVENLTGGTASDDFEILTTGQVTGNLNGGSGAGINSLNYASWVSSVSVTLFSATVGNASAVTGIANNLTIVTGGAGDDSLTGNSSRNSVLIGGEGADTLSGLSGRDILIGGLAADTISGVGGDDLLIAGRTQHDYDRDALLAIISEWTSTQRNFSTRVSNLSGTGTGTRLNGSVFLNVDSVFNDPESLDSLTGGASSDWFFADAAEITDFVTTGNNADRLN